MSEVQNMSSPPADRTKKEWRKSVAERRKERKIASGVHISIRTKVTFAFVLLMAMTIFGLWLMNTIWLPSYYEAHKKQTVEKVYNEFYQKWSELYDTADSDDAREEALDQLETEFLQSAARHDVSFVILDSSWNVILSSASSNEERMQTDRIQSFLFKDMIGTGGILSTDPRINIIYNDKMNSDYVELIAVIGDSSYPILINSPVTSLRESAKISNRFLTYIGVVMILIGSVLVYVISTQITKPIRKLSELSRQIEHLDFTAKYTGHEKDEIGVLGSNMNHLSEQLEQTITDLKNANLELQKDLEHRQELDEMRRDFISNVSHELKTPIALIQGYAEGLQDGMAEDPESREYYLNVITDEADRMNKMVRKLLTLNQMEYGNTQITIARFDISEVIQSVINNSHLLLEEGQIQVLNDITEPLYVFGDEFQIEEVVSNYFSNAIHYCMNEKYISISTEEHDNHIRILVHNSGNQIPEESLDQVWVKFYKVDKARTREYGGSGIGLSIVKAIMEAHGQQFGVCNTVDGVTFWFELEKA